ncbi:hypothetical protein [Bradyrhizobium sp. ORS 285]|uniref:hypothetical protein n=1 Tax=Bradyrhizobium sp. ORS 285 TaxID=115808 RepID=UPI001FCBD2ED|nr:hypothetical protein [Bradyrhizobium sp. ORS 285]
MVELLALEAQQPHQMQRVGMTGILRQQLLATELRIEHSACAHVLDRDLVQLGQIAARCLAGLVSILSLLILATSHCAT